jgi:endonuclease G, mitochondrial
MVRRLDPVWGTEGARRLANADTHHYTNSCPQVHSFNDATWGDLEDWILSQERSRDSKGSVFTGPIFQESDPMYQGVRVPVAFYKVVAVIDDAKGQLSVTAFQMDQSGVMPPQPGAPMPEAPFDPGRFSVDQITLSELEERSGLDFGRLKDFDVLAAQPVPSSLLKGARLRLPLTRVQETVVGSLTCAPTRPPGRSITNPQQLLPLAKVAFESHATAGKCCKRVFCERW